MKKILIVVPDFGHGGTNRSLCNFLNTHTGENVAFSILSMGVDGPYKERFERHNLLPTDDFLVSAMHFRRAIKVCSLTKRIKYAFLKFRYMLLCGNDKTKLFKVASKKYRKYDFDTVIAFQEGTATEFSTYIQSKRHIGWIRCDYSNYLRIANKTDEEAVYEKIDNVVCVSNYTASVFSSYYPRFAQRVRSIYNVIDTKGIIQSSRESISDEKFDSAGFILVSVGRMDPVKRFTHIPIMARKMLDNGCDFRWYIIGSGGSEEQAVMEEIENQKVAEQVVLLGEKNNPYPYIAASDVLVCPSISEACPNVVNEAKILHVPVVAADFPTASEYIDDGVNGFVVSIDEMAERLTLLCKDSDCYDKIKRGISEFEYKNDEIITAVTGLLLGEN